MTYRHIYGPVPSRRLGRSLGISPIPDKTCNYSCVYCMLGRTDHMTSERQLFFPLEDIVAELADALAHTLPPPDHISIVGNGEPTLYLRLGDLIDAIHRISTIPVAVISNGALLAEPDVRIALAKADVVMTSFNAPDEQTFRRINRPSPCISFDAVKQGLLAFARMERSGELWVEVMLVKGLNDSPNALQRIRCFLQEVAPYRVFIDTPLRPPAEPWVQPIDRAGMAQAEEILGITAREAGSDVGTFTVEAGADPLETLAAICKRHPMREDQVAELLVNSGIDPLPVLDALRHDGRFTAELFEEQTFYLVRDDDGGRRL